MRQKSITIVGAGISGLWQAVTLASRGYDVHIYRRQLVETSPDSYPASWYAGGMLAPFCEGETAEAIVVELGQRSLELWREIYPEVIGNGSLVVAAPRDRADLQRFARLTNGHVSLDEDDLAALEPDLDGRFRHGLHYPLEAHLAPRKALEFLEQHAGNLGVSFVEVAEGWTGDEAFSANGDVILDCRGLSARETLPGLRGVRGEMAVLRTNEVHFSRPIRLLHPRFPLYVVPWGDGQFMVGATVVEREDAGPVTVRSALDLLGHVYALHPGFGEAEIVSFGAGVRPAFASNTPRIVVHDNRLYINGMYRHGFLTAPALAELVATYLETGAMHPEVFVADCSERRASDHGCPDAA